MWRVRLVAELEPGVVTETELARIERDEQASLAELGLRLDEAKRLTAALQAQLVPAQVAAVGACRRLCEACGRVLTSKGHYGRRSAPCSATCRCECDGGSPVPARLGARRRALLCSTLARTRWRLSWPT